MSAKNGENHVVGWEGNKWNAQDGTSTHKNVEEYVEDKVTDHEKGIFVSSEVEIELESGKNGKIDTLIEHDNKYTVIDYKTNNMHDWTESDARRYGKEHGQQVQEYVSVLGKSRDTEGYIVALGRQPEDPNVLQTYVDTLSEQGVKIKFPEGYESSEKFEELGNSVVNSVNQIIDERGESVDEEQEASQNNEEAATQEIGEEPLVYGQDASINDQGTEPSQEQALPSTGTDEREAYDYYQSYGY